MRAVAESIATRKPKLFAVSDISAGDALALATRFNCGWAYRGAQGLFWSEGYHAREVHDRYLPIDLLNPFERRGLLEVRGDLGKDPVALVATRFSGARTRVREWRFLRNALRAIDGGALVFLANCKDDERVGLTDLGFERIWREETCAIFAKA